MNEEVVIGSKDVTLVIVSFLALAVTVGLMVFNLLAVFHTAASAAQTAKDAAETHAAVCVYRNEIASQAQQSESFLNSHPDGLPGLGISAAQIEQGIAREKAAVAALSGLHCAV